MRSFVAAFVFAAVVSVLATPLARLIALKVGAVSQPGGRHIHSRNIPRLGGIAICAALFAPLIALFFVESSVALVFRQETRKVVGLVVGGLAMCALGATDDIRGGVRPLHKLYAQVLAGGFAFWCGFRIDAVSIPIIGGVSMGIFALPITTLWIVGIINAVNLIDGLDGLAAGVVFFAGLTNFIVAMVTDSTYVALLMAATLGAVLGFLAYNWNPARIFMGDSGSYFLGFILAVTSLVGSSQKASTAVSLIAPIVALGVPIFDTLLAMVRRVLEKRSMFSPDRGHIHHRLLDLGLTHRRAVLTIYGISVAFTLAAIAISLGRAWQAGVAMLGASGVLVGLVRFLGYFELIHQRRRQQARIRAPESERLRQLIPRMPLMFERTRTEQELFALVAKVAEAADLAYVEIAKHGDDNDGPIYRWGQTTPTGPFVQEILTVRYDLGPPASARAELRFGYQSEQTQVPPETDILFQIIADVVMANLVRQRSTLAMQSVEARESSATPATAT